jgi:hypothetical protein
MIAAIHSPAPSLMLQTSKRKLMKPVTCCPARFLPAMIAMRILKENHELKCFLNMRTFVARVIGLNSTQFFCIPFCIPKTQIDSGRLCWFRGQLSFYNLFHNDLIAATIECEAGFYDELCALSFGLESIDDAETV